MSLAIALALGIAAAASFSAAGRLRRELAESHAREHALAAEAAEAARLASRVRHLQREVETLSAIREVALIANDDVSFERILAEVLKVVEDLVGARSLAIALAGEHGGAPALRARRSDGATVFHEAPRPGAQAGCGSPGDVDAATRGLSLSGKHLALDPRALAEAAKDKALVDEAFRSRRMLARAEGQELVVATLLYADAEIGGVLLARIPAAGRPEEELAAIPPALVSVAKHVALAIQKPTLYDRAVVDSLTRLFTKRHFTSQLQKACAVARRSGRPFALVLCDIDHFKRVNDTHGHLSGDIVLSEVAAVIARAVRETDTAYRYGGEEMAVLAPETDEAQARGLAERLRAAIEARPLVNAKGEPLKVTASFGVASFSRSAQDPSALISAADAALYESKRAGRNRVTAASDAAEHASAA